MRRRPKVTRQMFLEEYARQLVAHSSVFRNITTLGEVLAHTVVALDSNYTSAWPDHNKPAREACRVLGIAADLEALRKLPKE